MNTTLYLAIWGAVLSTILAIIEILKFWKDRAHIVVSVKGGYKIWDENNPYGDKVLICISVVNRGRRPVTISGAGLLMPPKSKMRYVVCMDPITTGKQIELNEGKAHDYLLEEENIGIPSSKYVAWVKDVTGRFYWSHNILMRFIKVRKIK